MCDNCNGTLLCSISNDKSLKIFDIVNFDMINMMRLDYIPMACCWIHSEKDPIQALCVYVASTNSLYLMLLLLFFTFKRSEKDSCILRIYDANGSSQPMHKLEKVHYQPVHLIKVKLR